METETAPLLSAEELASVMHALGFRDGAMFERFGPQDLKAMEVRLQLANKVAGLRGRQRHRCRRRRSGAIGGASPDPIPTV